MKCRHCGEHLNVPFIDLGSAPPSNAYLTQAGLSAPEKWYPLQVLVCTACWLVQTEDYAHQSELFSADYAYFSSFSKTWLCHAEAYVDRIIERLGLNEHSFVVEVASNDGCLLQYVQERGVPSLGIEPTCSTAQAARAKGIEVVEEFFDRDLARRLVASGRKADLIVANNVLPHVPQINDFVSGFAHLLKPDGVATFEFPHFLRLVEGIQFDTIYHEHFSYLSFTTVMSILKHNGLGVFDVEEIPTHGGSLRVYAQRSDTGQRGTEERVHRLLSTEVEAGLNTMDFYQGFQSKADRRKNNFLSFLLQVKKSGKTTVAYGAAAKGNTFLNYAGIRSDLVRFVVDRNPAKQGKFMPGSRIPIVGEDVLRSIKPDYVVVLPWNLKEEVSRQLDYVQAWGGRIVIADPSGNAL